MRKLNRRTRAINTAADVLAFPLHHRRGRVSVRDADPDGVVRLGDVVISFDTARRQARQRGVSINEEIAELFAHGLLHLLGYDHKTRRESEAMERLTRRLLGGHESGAKV